jgi:DNA polymerase-1
MRHLLFCDQQASYKVAVLVKTSAMKQQQMEEHYVTPLETAGIPREDIIGFNLKYNDAGKAPVKFQKEYLEVMLKAADSVGVTTLYCTDGAYFKTLTKERKAEVHYGGVLPCKIPDYEHMNVVLGTNYQVLFYKPEMQAKLTMSLDTVSSHIGGTHKILGADIIKSEYYPEGIAAVAEWLKSLHQYPALTCDIETFSLDFWAAGIGTIGFAWDQGNGGVIRCDWEPELTPYTGIDSTKVIYGCKRDNLQVKHLLKKFLSTYKGKLTYHNANFDVKILIYELFMDDMLDQQGLLNGLEVLAHNIDDTKIITYLAKNSCAGNTLGLKENAHAFAGNYAESDIKDIRYIPLDTLLRYNLVDCLSTWYVYDQNYPIMLADDQKSIYDKIMIPSVKVILQMELTGMCLDMKQVIKAESELKQVARIHENTLTNSPVIIAFTKQLQAEEFVKQNLLWKKKQEPLEYFKYIQFKPGSNPQLQQLFHEFLDYEVIDLTDTKQPAVGGKTIKKHLARCTDPEHLAMFEALAGLSEVNKILSTFINAFLTKSVLKADGHYYLHGNFNLGGTVSGRLSSSKPNLQNIPSSSTYAKIIKKCFCAPPGWLMIGPDFNSLEDYISALTTKDPNKLKVYTDGYDGHCLRAFSYWPDRLPGIVDTVDSINSIKSMYPDVRQHSKAPTFALTYQGTWHTLVNNIGMTAYDAKAVEANYHVMYAVSDQWVQTRLDQASKDGYVTVAFGLRVRTPILGQTIRGKKSTPYEAGAEGRTAGNAMGQSYGMLNNYAGIKFQERTIKSEYALEVRPMAHIHDAQYMLIKNNVGCVKWVNDNLIDCMAWQDLPELHHDTVKIGAELDIFYPDWSKSTTIPNHATKQEILDLCK